RSAETPYSSAGGASPPPYRMVSRTRLEISGMMNRPVRRYPINRIRTSAFMPPPPRGYVRRSPLLLRGVFHGHDSVGHDPLRRAQQPDGVPAVVADQHRAVFPEYLVDDARYEIARRVVEPFPRLVEQQQPRRYEQRLRQPDLLRRPLRQRVELLVP